MIVRGWKKGDLEKIQLQPSQEYMKQLIDYNVDLTDQAFTFEVDNEIIAIGGLNVIWEGRAELWSLISKYAGRYLFRVISIAQTLIQDSGCKRIEATVDVGFESGVRFIKLLGFNMEGYLQSYRPDGKDVLLFTRIQ